MSRRLRGGLTTAAAAVLGGGLALRTGSGWALAALAPVLTVPIGCYLWNLAARKGLTAALQAAPSAGKHQPVTVRVTVRPGFLPPVGPVTAELEVHNDLTDETSRRSLPLTAAGDCWIGDTDLTSDYCGRLRLTVTAVSLWDPLALLRCRKSTEENVKIAVVPELTPLSWDPAMGLAREDEGESASRRGDDRAEILQLREYQPGDDIRCIHWKLSSKLDRLMWREPGSTVSRSLLLDWNPAGASPRAADALAEALFSVGCHLTEEGIPYTLALRENGGLRLEPIGGREELSERLVLALRSRGGVLSEPLPEFGRILRFTADAAEESDNTVTLCCSETPQTVRRGVWFPPEGCVDALEKLEVSYD